MKIAIFHELDFGGARRTVDEFSKRLNKIFDLDLYYIDEKEDRSLRGIYRNKFLYPFYPKSWKGGNWKGRLYRDTVELINLYNLHKKIARDIESENYDYVFVHPSKFTQAPFLLRFLKNKCIYYCQEPLRIVYDPFLSDISNIKFPKNIYEFLIRKIRKLIDLENFKNASIVLANSNYSKEFINKSYGRQAMVCYLGVDTDLFKPQNLDKSIDVLFIGNKNSGYNLLNKLPGFFENKLKIRAMFRENDQSCITDKELAEIYNKSKVLVALNHNEPFGLIPLEAMACGTPVIAVKEGGYKESIVDNKTGFLIPRNSKYLCEKISQIINNEKMRTEMGENARRNILQNWTWNKSVDRFLKIIKYAK